MYVVTRYVILELLKYFVAAVAALTLIITPVMGVKQGLSQGIPATIILWTMPFMLPEMLGITVPVALLFSTVTVFGRMTGANEVIALKSLGISPMAVLWPAIVLATFLSLGSVYLYEIAATWGKPHMLRYWTESIEEIAYSALQKNKFCERPEFSVLVRSVKKPANPGDRPRLIQPTITIKGPPKTTIYAAEATFYTDWTTRTLNIECVRGKVDVEGGARVFFGVEPVKWSIPIPEPDPNRYHRDWAATRNVSDLVAELQTTLRQLEGLREARKQLGVPETEVDRKKIEDCLRDIRRLKAEPYRRWANGFTCLCFALLGAPVAMLWRHADVLTNFFVCFLPILAIYYPLLMFSDTLATSPYGHMPPISWWTANVALLMPAIALLRWVVRH